MKTYHWIIAALLLLAANNYVLLKMIGYFDQIEQVPYQPGLSEPQTSALNTAPRNTRLLEETTQVLAEDEVLESAQEYRESEEQSDLAQEFRKFTQSDDFVAVMDRYSMTAGKRMMEKMERLARMSGQELYQTFSTSDNPTEIQLALQGLMQGKFNDLSITELKDVYQSTGTEFFGRYEALQVLLEKDDPEAIEWAKDALKDPMLAMGGGYEIVSTLFDKDPEYVKSHVEGLKINDIENSRFSASMLLQQPELQEIFYKNNLDDLLASDNSQIFQSAPYNLELEMSREQQVSLAEFYSSSNRHKRNFAIYLSRNIEDPQLLRDAYSQLRSKQDRQTMLSIMSADQDHKELARELAAQSVE